MRFNVLKKYIYQFKTMMHSFKKLIYKMLLLKKRKKLPNEMEIDISSLGKHKMPFTASQNRTSLMAFNLIAVICLAASLRVTPKAL